MKRTRSGSIVGPRMVATVSPGAMSAAFNKKQVRKLSRRISKLEKEDELKFVDTNFSISVDSTGAVEASNWLQVVQGDGQSNREGRRIVLKSLHVRAEVSLTPALANNSSTAHFYIVLDRQCNGAACTAADVFTSTDFRSCFRNMANINRFKILHHWIHTFTPAASVGTTWGNVSTAWEHYMKLKDLVVDYDANAGAITDLTSNNILLLCGTDGNSDDLITTNGYARITFVG